MLKIDDLQLTYPNGNAGLIDINLEIATGELVAIVGPSGSGKTTLLRTVAGFLQPSDGTITIGESQVFGAAGFVPTQSRQLGMVFQQHAIWPHWNVFDNVAYPLKIQKVSRGEQRRRVAAVLEQVGLTDMGHRDPATLSGGQRQRVSVARAIVAEPKMLLLDEALSALDEPLRDRMRQELRSLCRNLGLTMLHVTHDRSEALAIADRILVLDGGRIAQFASPDELLSSPVSPFVARFLSDATVVRGQVVDGSFMADDYGIRYGLELASGRNLSGELVLMPGDIEIGNARMQQQARVVSCLFTRTHYDVLLDWQGVSVRVAHRGDRLDEGERVGLRIRQARFYANDDSIERVVQPQD